MSTFYYIVCDGHKERCEAAARTGGGTGPLGDSDVTLPAFIVTHADCPVRIVGEAHPDANREDYKDWDAENVAQLVDIGTRQPVQQGEYRVAPIVMVGVDKGKVSWVEMLAPGLPDGQHDLFPAPLATPGQLVPHPLQQLDDIACLHRVQAAALRVASSRRSGIVTDQATLDALDAALEGR